MLSLAIDNATLGQVVRRQLDADFVARNNSDEVLTHSTGDVGHHLRSGFQLDPEPGVGKRLCNSAFDLEGLFFFSQNLTSNGERIDQNRSTGNGIAVSGAIHVATLGRVAVDLHA